MLTPRRRDIADLRLRARVVFALQRPARMLPVPLCREVPIQAELSAMFWKVVAGAALASFLAVVLFAWDVSRHPRKVMIVEVPSSCATR